MRTLDGRILFVGPDEDCDSETCRRFSGLGLEVDYAPHGQEALERCGEQSYKLAVVQLDVPVSKSLPFVRLLKSRQPETPVLVFSHPPSLAELVAALRSRGTDYLAAHSRIEELLRRIEGFIGPSKV